MDVTKPYEHRGFGAMDVHKTYEFIGFGAMDVHKPLPAFFRALPGPRGRPDLKKGTPQNPARLPPATPPYRPLSSLYKGPVDALN